MDAELRACGVQHFTVRYDEDLQSGEVELRDVQVTDHQIRCVLRAADHTPYFVLWSQPRLGMRYYEIAQQLRRPRALARAHTYFDERPELGKPPLREEGQSDLDFVRSIERFCGPRASGAFDTRLTTGGTAVLSSEWMTSRQQTLDGITDMAEILGCLMRAGVIADLQIGFLGNDTAAEPSD